MNQTRPDFVLPPRKIPSAERRAYSTPVAPPTGKLCAVHSSLMGRMRHSCPSCISRTGMSNLRFLRTGLTHFNRFKLYQRRKAACSVWQVHRRNLALAVHRNNDVRIADGQVHWFSHDDSCRAHLVEREDRVIHAQGQLDVGRK